MILVSGFNVYPNEVEAVAAQPSRHSRGRGRRAARRALRRSGRALRGAQGPGADRAASIIEFCRKSLAGYKVPKHVYFRKELPKTNVGKILRKELRGDSPS